MAAYLHRRAWDERELSFTLWALWKKRLELQAHLRLIQAAAGFRSRRGGVMNRSPSPLTMRLSSYTAEVHRLDRRRGGYVNGRTDGGRLAQAGKGGLARDFAGLTCRLTLDASDAAFLISVQIDSNRSKYSRSRSL
jgi:hypothetical protein